MFTLKIAALLVLMLNILPVCWPQSTDFASQREQLKSAMQQVPCNVKQQILSAYTDMLVNNLPFSSVETAENQALAPYETAKTAMQNIWNSVKQMKSNIASCFSGKTQNQTAQQIVQQFVNADFSSMTPKDMCNQGISVHQQLSKDDNTALHSCQSQQLGNNAFEMFKSGGPSASGNNGNSQQNFVPAANGGSGSTGFNFPNLGGTQPATAGDFCDMLMSYVKQKAQNAREHALPCNSQSTAATGTTK
uniref:Uncharacterized protein n=1 Tax=Globodera rostochiensis TaxID=31243 RepID=A0A914H872_GLORO